DSDRTELFEEISETISNIKPTETARIKELQTNVTQSLNKIRINLEQQSGEPVNFQKSERDVRNALLRFESVLIEKKEIIDSREGHLVFLDSDKDGLSDYDELYIYGTDPNNPR